MNSKCAKAAAVATWWTLLIAVAFVTLQWEALQWMLRARPAWVQTVWGGELNWDTVRVASVWLIGVFKLATWLVFLLAVWLSVLSRRLRKAGL